jgi:hypothetical protein
MPYSDFTLEMVTEKLGVTTGPGDLFVGTPPVPPPQWLLDWFDRTTALATASEQARRESFIAPVLRAVREVCDNRLAVYSGQRMDVDAARGLTGECDYLLAVAPPILPLRPPLLTVVEAKKADLDLGMGQCCAEMVAARDFNRKAKQPERPIFGCVTNGQLWLFMRLVGEHIDMDSRNMYFGDTARLLGVFRAILDEYDRATPSPSPAPPSAPVAAPARP